MENTPLLLSLFPGIDILGRAFDEAGYCVVRGPDLITGGDIRSFTPPSGRFDGIIAGSPCQDFSNLNRSPGTYSYEMLEEFKRVVRASNVEWFLYENVATAPGFQIEGYKQQRFTLDLAWFTNFSRNRSFVFGSKSGVMLNPLSDTRSEIQGSAVVGSDPRSFRACCDIQGLPKDFDLPFFTLDGKKQAVANGVPMALGSYLASLIATEVYSDKTKEAALIKEKRCGCGCGRVVIGRAKYAGAACRKRAQRARQNEAA